MFQVSEVLARAKRPLALAAVAAGVIATSVTAASAFSSRTREACADDYRRLCPAYKEGSASLRSCMESNANSISPKCIRAAVDNGDVPRSKARAMGYRN
jgi:hypothetical protein